MDNWMTISVFVKTKSRNPGVKQLDSGQFEVAVAESPIDGKANLAVIKALAKFIGIASIDIHLLSGHSSRHKRFRIPDGSLDS